MAVTSPPLTPQEFQATHGNDQRWFFWYGEAREKAVPTGLHGLLQMLIGQMLREHEYRPASEVELRIVPEARPRPDLIASRDPIPLTYPDKALEIVVEIITPDDRFQEVREICRRYSQWGFEKVYTVDAASRTVLEWMDGAMVPVASLAGISVAQIWQALDKEMGNL